MWAEIGVAVAGSSVLTALVDRWFFRRKVSAEAEVTLSEGITEGYGAFVATLRQEREELRQERAEMREELREAHRDNLALRQEIGALRTELRAVKSDLVRVTAGLPPLTDWSSRP